MGRWLGSPDLAGENPEQVISSIIASLRSEDNQSLPEHIRATTELLKQHQAGTDAVGARQERTEQREFWLKIAGGAAVVVLLLGLVGMSEGTARAELVKQYGTALIASIPTAAAAFFAGKNAAKKD